MMPSMNDNPLLEQSVDSFLQSLASRAATPGGGSASAVLAAVAAALCGMVGRLNDKATGEPGVLHETIARADELRQRLQRLAAEDVCRFEALLRTWKTPDTDPHKVAAKEAATIAATETPLSIMSAAVEVMELAVMGLRQSKKNCVSDAGVAGLAAHAALEGAALNVMINLPGIADEMQRESLRCREAALRDRGRTLRLEVDGLLNRLFG